MAAIHPTFLFTDITGHLVVLDVVRLISTTKKTPKNSSIVGTIDLAAL